MSIRDDYNGYMRVYMLKRYHRRMREAHAHLGGCCKHCGVTNDLEMDHIDPETKLFAVGKCAVSVAEAKFWAEVDKCQLLCNTCHKVRHGSLA